jgi:hypothetical protein
VHKRPNVVEVLLHVRNWRAESFVLDYLHFRFTQHLLFVLVFQRVVERWLKPLQVVVSRIQRWKVVKVLRKLNARLLLFEDGLIEKTETLAVLFLLK